MLNAGDADAQIAITVFFVDREPAGPYRCIVPTRRTRHIRFNDLTDPETVPVGTEFASLTEPDMPAVVQHTRLDFASAGAGAAQHHRVRVALIGAAAQVERRCRSRNAFPESVSVDGRGPPQFHGRFATSGTPAERALGRSRGARAHSRQFARTSILTPGN